MNDTDTSRKVKWVSLRAPLQVTIYIDQEGRKTDGTIRDISSTGLFVVCKESFTVGSKVQVRFRLPNHSQPIKATISVVWTKPDSGFGAEFLDLDTRTQSKIKDFVMGVLSLPTLGAFLPSGRAA